MKKILIALILLLNVSLYAQNMIGKSKQEVYNKLILTWSSDDIESSKMKYKGNECFLYIVGSGGANEMWYAFSNDQCVYIMYSLPSAAADRFLDNIKVNKNLQYDQKQDAWINASKRYKWSMKPIGNRERTQFYCEKI